MKWTLLVLVLFLGGCATTPKIETEPARQGLAGAWDALVGSRGSGGDAGAVTNSESSGLWIFSWVGGIALLGGIAMFVFVGDRKLLVVGILVALVPTGANLLVTLFFPALKWLVLIATGFSLVAGIAIFGQWFGWWQLRRTVKKQVEIVRKKNGSACAVAELEKLGSKAGLKNLHRELKLGATT